MVANGFLSLTNKSGSWEGLALLRQGSFGQSSVIKDRVAKDGFSVAIVAVGFGCAINPCGKGRAPDFTVHNASQKATFTVLRSCESLTSVERTVLSVGTSKWMVRPACPGTVVLGCRSSLHPGYPVFVQSTVLKAKPRRHQSSLA